LGLYLVVSCQFHLPFYMSRTLPNTYALFLCTLAFAYWLLGKQQVALALVTFGGVCFRCDLVLLALPMGVWLLVSKPGELANTILYPLLALVVGIGLSLSIDSFFWRRLVWPELEVLLFNTVENRSADWGTAPWHWYWTSALPRVLMGEVLLVACGLFLRPVGKKWVDQRVSSIGFLVFAYIGLYSFLPHKELRFLFPILPGLAILAATGLIKLYFPYRTKCVYKSDTLNFSLLALAAAALLLTSLGSAFALYISSYNYPGGVAITEFSTHYAELRRQDPAMPLPYLHIDVMPAMTGVCRFLEYMPDWRYSKTENLTDFSEFTHLLSPHRDIPGFTPIFFPIKGYETFLIRKRRLILRDKIFIHQRDDIQFRYEPSEDSTCRHS
jgi:alpha-1,6-mannosyltransferase